MSTPEFQAWARDVAGRMESALVELLPAPQLAPNRLHEVAVTAFYPGPSHNLDPKAAAADGSFPQKISDWNPLDDKLQDFAREILVRISFAVRIGVEPDEHRRVLHDCL